MLTVTTTVRNSTASARASLSCKNWANHLPQTHTQNKHTPFHLLPIGKPIPNQLKLNRNFSSSSCASAMPTIFDKILDKEIPSEKVYEDDVAYAFKDIGPQAPTHVLVIPKVRDIPRISEAKESHKDVLGHLMLVAGKLGRELCGEKGFRLVVNDGDAGGQTVYHLHIHILGGRQMTWPPG